MLGNPFDHQTDIYSLGLLFLEMLLGLNPLSSDSTAELFFKHDRLFSSTYGHFSEESIEKSPMFKEIFE